MPRAGPCSVDGCSHQARDSKLRACRAHGGGPKCPECGANARDEGQRKGYCCRHGGGQRCESEACRLLTERFGEPRTLAVAKDQVTGERLCLFCYRALYPEKAPKAHRRLRKEHFVLAELQRRLPALSACALVWDCRVPGGCSLKRPDLLADLGDRYVQVEVDELYHGGGDEQCASEDARLEVIASDVGKPGLVLRLRVDEPRRCFALRRGCYERLAGPFDLLMSRAEQAVESYLSRGFVDGLEQEILTAE